MAIISAIGRRSLSTRLLVGSIYMALCLGASTMIYPFLLMIAGSTKSSVDSPDAEIVPPFLRSELALYRKHVEGFFNEDMIAMKSIYDLDAPSFRDVLPPEDEQSRLVDEWASFLNENEIPETAYSLSYVNTPISRGVIPRELRKFKRLMEREFKQNIDRLNAETDSEFVSWNDFTVDSEYYLSRTSNPLPGGLAERFRIFKKAQPIHERYYFSVEGFFKTEYLKTQYSRDISKYNSDHGTNYTDYGQVHLQRTVPDRKDGFSEQERRDWEIFVREILNTRWIEADQTAAGQFREYLQAKYGQINDLNRLYSAKHADFGEIPFPGRRPSGMKGSDWEAFLQGWRDAENGRMHMMPASSIRIDSVEFKFRDHLQAKYGDIGAFNARSGTSFGNFMDILPPQREWHHRHFKTQMPSLRVEFVQRNFISVADFVLLHGRAVYNTLIYCSMGIICALVFNPIAAYALSRYKPPSTYKILLFLMLTMAFPPMVTQIPAFLMLREFGLLNTFWALILPGVANGYSIFLLKGFFDSLPRELYESAELDGAGEIRMFWQFTMALSTPILAVIALQTFTHTYSNFMMALLVCQDEKMWTLMPWLYQFQRRSSEGIIYASLLIAAVPTFMIFVFCQKIIIRGIVVPSEK